MLKYKIKYLQSLFHLFFKKNEILLIETNDCHAECLPAYSKYLIDLGFTVDILTTKENFIRNPFAYIDSNIKKNIKFCIFPLKYMSYLYNFFLNRKYKNVIWGTKYNYYFSKNIDEIFNIDAARDIFIEHHVCNIDIKNTIILSNIFNDNYKKNIVCPVYMTSKKIIHKKNKITRFVCVGGIDQCKRDYFSLIEAIKILECKYSFEIIVISSTGELVGITSNTLKNITYIQNATFDTVYNEIIKSDFILPLLNIKIPEHARYLYSGASGSFQLSFALNTPMVIQSIFAKKLEITKNESIIYDDLADGIENAIKISEMEYKNMSENLSVKISGIYETSLINFKYMLRVH